MVRGQRRSQRPHHRGQGPERPQREGRRGRGRHVRGQARLDPLLEGLRRDRGQYEGLRSKDDHVVEVDVEQGPGAPQARPAGQLLVQRRADSAGGEDLGRQ